MSTPNRPKVTIEDLAQEIDVDETLVLEALDEVIADHGSVIEVLDEVDVLQSRLTDRAERALRARFAGGAA